MRLEVRDQPETTVLAKDEDKPWQIVQPIQGEADQARVERIVDRLAKLGASRVVTESVADTSVYGLAEPQLTAKLTLKDGREEILLVGDKNPHGTAYYTQREGNEALYLVYASTVDDLKRLISEPPKKPTPTPTAMITPPLTATPPLTTTATPTTEP